jgi:spermidine synthase
MSLSRNVRCVAGVLSLLILAAVVWAQALVPGTIVARVTSDYQTITILDTPGDYRQMIFDARLDGTDPIQSEMNKKDPTQLTLAYSQHMIASVALAPKPKSILIVGLGGACLERFLYKILPETKIVTVELDPEVANMARKYFSYKEDERQVLALGDGRKYIEQSKDKFDIIMLDAFSAISIPYPLSTQEFLNACKAHLAPGGLVVANLWVEEPTYRSMIKTYDAVFPEWHVVRCLGSTNAILTALPEKRGLTLDSWKKAAQAFDATYKTGLNLAALLDVGLEAKTDIPPAAKVLLDKDEPKGSPSAAPAAK